MTAKRFGVTPELPKGWVDIIDIDDNRTLCNIRIEYATNMIKLLNELHEENKELKEKNEFAGLLANHRGEMISFANALIQDLDDETIQDMWGKFKDEMYKEWKQKRGIE